MPSLISLEIYTISCMSEYISDKFLEVEVQGQRVCIFFILMVTIINSILHRAGIIWTSSSKEWKDLLFLLLAVTFWACLSPGTCPFPYWPNPHSIHPKLSVDGLSQGKHWQGNGGQEEGKGWCFPFQGTIQIFWGLCLKFSEVLI